MNAAIADLQSLSSSDYDRNRQSQDHSTVSVLFSFFLAVENFHRDALALPYQ